MYVHTYVNFIRTFLCTDTGHLARQNVQPNAWQNDSRHAHTHVCICVYIRTYVFTCTGNLRGGACRVMQGSNNRQCVRMYVRTYVFVRMQTIQVTLRGGVCSVMHGSNCRYYGPAALIYAPLRGLPLKQPFQHCIKVYVFVCVCLCVCVRACVCTCA